MMSRTPIMHPLKILATVGAALLLWALIALCSAGPAWAAELTVNSPADPGVGTCDATECTLREAVAAANSNGEADTITFDLPEGQRTITLASGQISFTETAFETEVDGGGVVTVSGNDASRVFDVAEGAALVVRGLTVRDGFVPRSDGPVDDQSGGGIRNGGALTVSDSTVSDNFADQRGGGIYSGEGDTLAVTGSTFSGNDANLGAGIFNDGDSDGEDGTATIANSVFSGNAAVFSGGAIYNSGVLDVAGTVMTGNTANGNVGGAVAQFRLATMTIDRSTVSGNTSQEGGGIFIDNGSATIDRTTVSGNTATEEGGGIHNNISPGEQAVTVRNSTVSGNSAANGGGGVSNSLGLLVIENTTITGNTAPEGQGSGVASSGRDDITRTEVSSSIIAANEGPGPSAGTDVDFVGFTTNTFYSEGYNVIGDGNATDAFNQPGDQTGVDDPGLGPLADNGGPTLTHALLSGSPAIDRVAADACPPPARDQRGVKRPQDGDDTGPARCDSGSFEKAQPPPPPPPPPACSDGRDNDGDGGTDLRDPGCSSRRDDSERNKSRPDPTPDCTITGTKGDDTLRGTERRDVICARGGNDTVIALGGNDIVRGGRGNDSILGGDGDDELYGERGRDVLVGGDGRDRLVGGPGNDDTDQ